MYSISERQHRFMGTGEGTHEMPEKLLDQLTKRATYYKDKMPTQVPVSEVALIDPCMFIFVLLGMSCSFT